MSTDLSGKKAIVTGASRGIGKAIALALANAGCDVVVNYLSKEAEANTTVDAITRLGRRAVAVQGDVSRSADVLRIVHTAEAEIGPTDILVNNAGRVVVEGIDQMSEASWDDVIRVNLKSVFLMTQAVLPGMRARKWGRIINLTSVAAQAGSVLAVHYSAAKGGVISATKSYARLLAKEGITVNAISPALIATEMVKANPRISPDMIPMGRFGTVE
ncbi:MAG TPA: SDR family NAD(P)-dependent oxidoreductase, partial [Vicinamibacterales bacterium]